MHVDVGQFPIRRDRLSAGRLPAGGECPMFLGFIDLSDTVGSSDAVIALLTKPTDSRRPDAEYKHQA